MRPASGFATLTNDAKKASWEELSREQESDGETKNYSVPPELIALARANRKSREVGTLTPLAPKPVQDVVVMVPGPARVSPDLGASDALESSLQAPSVPIPAMGASHEPESAPTVVAAPGYAAAASSPPAAPSPSALDDEASGEAHVMPAELGNEQPLEERLSEAELAHMVESTGVRRTSRRARRSARVEMPALASVAARAAALAPARAKSYVPLAVGAGIVGAYVVLCYYANALLAGLP